MITTIKNLLRKAASDSGVSTASTLGFVESPARSPSRRTPRDPDQIRYTLHRWLEIRRDGDIRILIDNQSGSITACNDTAWLLLSLLREGATFGQLVDGVLQAFDIGEAQAREDTRWFFNHLDTLGYLEEVA